MKKTMDACKMNHFEKTITMTRKFYNAACVLDTPEYTELMNAMKEHPNYEMKIRKIAKAAAKKSYRNLTYDNMASFFMGLKKDKTERNACLSELEAVKAKSKIQPSPYSYVKSWFLENYGEEYSKYDKKDSETAAA